MKTSFVLTVILVFVRFRRGAAFSSAVWNPFQPGVPVLTQEDLLPDPMNDLKIEKFRPQDREGLISAFMTSPDFVWMLKDGDNLKEEDAEDMYSLTSFIVDFAIFLGENLGHVIKSVDSDGSFQGSMILIPPVTNFCMTTYVLAAFAKMGKIMPSAVRKDAGRMARFFSFFQAETSHHEVMHDCLDNHWYVVILGVAPSAQGNRVGSRLLQQAIHIAGDKPLYLDCHDDNVAYYEKNGFKCGKNYAFDVPKNKSKSSFNYNSMRRDPQL